MYNCEYSPTKQVNNCVHVLFQIILTYFCKLHPLAFHFYKVNFEFIGVCIIERRCDREVRVLDFGSEGRMFDTDHTHSDRDWKAHW